MLFSKAIFLVPAITSSAFGESNLRGAQVETIPSKNLFKDATDKGVKNTKKDQEGLPMGGYCWNHENGRLCFPNGRFQSVTYEGGDILFEEFENGKKYSYAVQNKKKLHDDFQSKLKSSNESASKKNKLEHVLSKMKIKTNGKKYGCKVEDAGGFLFDTSNKELMRANGDGSSVWKIANWAVTVNSDNIPISIDLPSENGDGYEFFTDIESVVPMKKRQLEGCDPVTQGNEFPELTDEDRDVFDMTMNANNPNITEVDFLAGNGHRDLGWVTDWSAAASNTQWCGAGTHPVTTGCPKPYLDYDFKADNACRRHDHGKYIQTTSIGVPRLECAVDADLYYEASHNWAVSAAYGPWGATSFTVGCSSYEHHYCWKMCGWWPCHGYCGERWVVKYGPSRYDSYTWTNKYKSRPKYCSYDYQLNYN